MSVNTHTHTHAVTNPDHQSNTVLDVIMQRILWYAPKHSS